jgi:hypothetical protein
MYFDHANNYWVAAVSLGYKAGKRVRRKVTGRTKTEVKVGYIYVQDTGQPGQNNLFRQFYGQIGKQALIVDERWNGGGQSDRTRSYTGTPWPLRQRLGEVKLRELTAGTSRRPWTHWPGGFPRAAFRSPVCAWSGPSGMPRSGIWSAGTWPPWSRPLPDGRAVRPRA